MSDHYVAYHNVDRMNRPLTAGDPLRVISKASLKRLDGKVVWMVVGEKVAKVSRKRFTLGSVFRVNEVGELEEEEFTHFARGSGNAFDPAPLLSEETWFDEFRLNARSFEGIQPIKLASHIDELKRIAAFTGFDIEKSENFGQWH